MNEPSESRPAVVRERLPNSMYQVEIGRGVRLTAHLAGGARALLTRLVEGDEVLVQLSPTDRGECRIVGRSPGTRGR